MTAKRGFKRFAAGVLVFSALLWPSAAPAFDFFGLFGDKPPAPSQQALPYLLSFDIADAPSGLKDALEQASTLYRTRLEPPPDGNTLVRRAQGDFAPMIDALWGAGYYNAKLTISIAGYPLEVGRQEVSDRTVRAAESFRAREPVPIKVAVQPGRLFQLRSIRVTDARTGQPFSAEELPPRVLKLEPGAPARAADIRAGQAALIDHFRRQSYPFVKVTHTDPVVYHKLEVMDVSIRIDRGRRAPFGPVAVSGKSNVDPAVVRSQIYIEPGDAYSPDRITETRNSILKLPAIGSVRIREADRLDANGQLPIVAEVADRKPRVIGFGAKYSTLDGPSVNAYWQHRNLFGGAESLRLEGSVFIPPQANSRAFDNLKDFEWGDLGGRFRASFVKPGLYGSRNDLLLDGMAERDATGGDEYGGYTVRRALGNAAIRHRFSNTFSAQLGVAVETGVTTDTLGEVDYTLVGIPASLTYDSTDRPLDPTKGFKVTAAVTPYPGFLGSTASIVESRVQASAYYAIDEEARYILAARVGLGSVAGSDLADIPSTHRFYAGGGGSVRGYRYRSLSPLGPTGEVVGGRSLVEGSVEARIRVTDTIGVVPFFDVGGAFEKAYPDFSEELRYAAGLGLRYYTAVGPIRVDVAFPLNPRSGDDAWALYVGIGQAF